MLNETRFFKLTSLPEEFQDEIIEGYDISDKENILIAVYTSDYSYISIIESRSCIMRPVSTTQTQNISTPSMFYLGVSHAKSETIENVIKYLQEKIRKGDNK